MVRLRSPKKSNVIQKDIELVVSKSPKSQERWLWETKNKIKNLKDNLKLLIFGQDAPIDKVTDSILLSRSGLGNDAKPLASLSLPVQLELGKRNRARQLAFQMGIHFERLICPNIWKTCRALLIGAPPGYVGHENGGVLTDAIKKSPYTVLLLMKSKRPIPISLIFFSR